MCPTRFIRQKWNHTYNAGENNICKYGGNYWKLSNWTQITLLARFMEDLQAEVQEMEFLQFSKGMDTMRREDFAEWLLHYTNEADNETYWENMRKKIPAGQVETAESQWMVLLVNTQAIWWPFSCRALPSMSSRPSVYSPTIWRISPFQWSWWLEPIALLAWVRASLFVK